MALVHIMEKQVSWEFWYFAIKHSTLILNQIPEHLGRKLTTPFELVHSVKPDAATWFELFSIGYFDHAVENNSKKSQFEVQILAGITVGWCNKSNTIKFYNPITRVYYSPPVFKLDKGKFPVSLFPLRLISCGGLTCGFLQHNTDPAPEPFPPGMQVWILLQCILFCSTIQSVPLPLSWKIMLSLLLMAPSTNTISP